MNSNEETKPVFVPKNLYGRIKERVTTTEFGSIEEYVTFVLEEVLKEDTDEEETAFSEKDEQEVKKRLRSLGYLD